MKKINPKKLISEILRVEGKFSESEFPVHVLPSQVQEIIRATSECEDYPIDYIASSILAASATAIGNSHSIHVKSEWYETSIFYAALVGHAGLNKSHPLSFAFEPLFEKDKVSDAEFKKAYKLYEEYKEMTKKEREELLSTSVIEEPILKKKIVSDITAESLASILQDNPRGICVYADELKSWFSNFNRYNNGSDESSWLSAFSAKTIIINRKNLQGSISIHRPFIVVVGTIQTKLLRELADGNRSSNGFMDRILFVYPKQQLKKYWSRKVLPSYITTKWKHIIEQLLNLELCLDDYGSPIPKSISYNPEALDLLYEWQIHNTDLSNQEPDEVIKGINSKLEIYISRFALVIQLLKYVCHEADKEYIDLETTQAAIELTEYFRKTAIRVQNSLDSSEVLKEIPTDKKELYSQLPVQFSTGEGIAIAQQLGISKDNFNRFLRDFKGTLFENYKYGHYKKMI